MSFVFKWTFSTSLDLLQMIYSVVLEINSLDTVLTKGSMFLKHCISVRYYEVESESKTNAYE